MAEKFDLKAIISAVDKMTPTLKGIQRSVKLTSKTFRDIGREGRNLMGSVGLPAGLAFSAVAYGAVRATRAAIEYASGIQDASERTGASVESYQALVNALGLVGGSAEDADMAFKTFNKGMAEAASGGDKNFLGLMKKMKIPIKNSSGEVRGLIDTLPDLADAFAKNTNPAVRTRMALELFGRSGLKMIPIMAKGRKAVEQWVTEQKRLGLIVGDESIAAMDDLGDSIGIVNTQIRSQLTVAIAKLVPVIQPMLKGLTEWIAANRELIQAKVVEVVKEIANWIKQTDWKQVGRDVRDTAASIGNIVQMLGGLKNVLIGIGIAFAAGPIASILGIVGAVWRFGAGLIAIVGGWSAVGTAILAVGKVFAIVGRAFLLNPVGLVLTAIAGAAYLVYKNWDSIKKWFSDFFVWMVGKIKVVGDWFKGLVPDWAKNFFGGKSPAIPQQPAIRQQPAITPLVRSGALQIAAGRQQLTGDMTVRFENAPPGMRVNPGKTNQPGVSMNPDVGYRSLALGF